MTGKKFLGKKNLEIKTLVRKFQFSKVLGQHVTGNKVLSFRFRGLFFPKIMWELLIKSQEIRSEELKSLRKKSFVLGKRGQVLDVFIKRTFLLFICLFLHGSKHLLFPCISIVKGLFSGDFLYEIILEPEIRPRK